MSLDPFTRWRMVATPAMSVGFGVVAFGFYYLLMGEPRVVQPYNPNAPEGIGFMFLGFGVMFVGLFLAGHPPRSCDCCGKLMARPYLTARMAWVGKRSTFGRGRFYTSRVLRFCDAYCLSGYTIAQASPAATWPPPSLKRQPDSQVQDA
jgi:hypothetical protein